MLRSSLGYSLLIALQLLLITSPLFANEGRHASLLTADAAYAIQAVLREHTHNMHPFVLIDKRNAHLWLLDREGHVLADTVVLLGIAVGDDTTPGVGNKPLDQIPLTQRTTPAGLFRAEHGRTLAGDDVIWIDYDAAVSMHRLRTSDPAERRPERMASVTTTDNRISSGCVNVPVTFYEQQLVPNLRGFRPLVVVLPETRPVQTLFAPSGGVRR